MFVQKVERKLLKAVQRVVYGSHLPPKDLSYINGSSLNDLMYRSILDDAPFMVARFGSIELSASLYHYITSTSLLNRYKLFIQGKIDYIRGSSECGQFLMAPLCNNAGFFPCDTSLLKRYSLLMREDVGELDCCCCSDWIREDLMENFYSEDIRFALLNDMEPYDYERPWSKALEGKNVLVVHPFAATIKSQYDKRELLWDNRDVLPKFNLKIVKAVQSIASEKVPFDTWFDALDYMKAEMDKTEYDIAIIGCGAYGFHLAAHAKRRGKKAVHLGGVTQVLFGIKGKRWDNLPAVSKFYNDYWVRPLPEEVPVNNVKVENGCYW